MAGAGMDAEPPPVPMPDEKEDAAAGINNPQDEDEEKKKQKFFKFLKEEKFFPGRAWSAADHVRFADLKVRWRKMTREEQERYRLQVAASLPPTPEEIQRQKEEALLREKLEQVVRLDKIRQAEDMRLELVHLSELRAQAVQLAMSLADVNIALPTAYDKDNLADKTAVERDWSNRNLRDGDVKSITDNLSLNMNLLKVDLSSNSIGAEGAKSLASMLAATQSITTLNVEHNQLGAEGAISIGCGVSRCPTITELNISSNRLKALGLRGLVQSIDPNSFLQLKVIRCSSNDIGDEGLATFHSKINSVNQQQLQEERTRLEYERAVAEWEAAKREASLQRLTPPPAPHNPFGGQSHGPTHQHAPRLQVLDLSNNGLGGSALDDFLDVIPSLLPNLTDLDLSLTRLSASSSLKLTQVLSPRPDPSDERQTIPSSIARVNVSDALLDDLSLSAFVPSEGVLRSQLTSLDLSLNRITASRSALLPIILMASPALTTLNLMGNSIGDGGVSDVVEGLLSLPNLKHLDLSSNFFSLPSARTISNLMRENDALAWETLNLSKNFLKDEGCAAICVQARASRSLTHLYLAGNELSDNGVAHIAMILSRKGVVLELLDVTLNEFSARGEAAIAEAVQKGTTKWRF